MDGVKEDCVNVSPKEGVNEVERWEQLLAQHRLDTLRDALDETEERFEREKSEPEPETAARLAAMRAELAARGRGAVSELLEFCLREQRQAGVGRCVSAISRLRRAGLTHRADELLGLARQWFPDDATIDWLEEHRGHESGPALDAARRAERVGDLETAFEHYDALAKQTVRLDERLSSVESAALVLRGLGRHCDAAERERERIKLAPGGDGSYVAMLRQAFDWWVAGHADNARESLRGLRDVAPEGVAAEQRYVRSVASDVLVSLDQHDDDACACWVEVSVPARRPVLEEGGAGIVELVRWLRPSWNAGVNPLDSISSMGHVRHALAPIAQARRVVLDESAIVAALQSGALIIIDEERSTDTGFLWIRRYDPVARILELIDPSLPGPILRTLNDTQQRCSLFGFGGLLLWDPDATIDDAKYDDALRHCEALDHVDACEIDEHGRSLSRARKMAMADAGLEQTQAFPILHGYRGEALLAKMEAGELASAPDSPYERWLSATRVLFPHEEWPLQLHARALQMQGRLPEAGIAWNDAALRDPWDYRNWLGEARACLATGEYGRAFRRLRRAEALAPAQWEIHHTWARALLEQGADPERALLHSGLALELAGEQVPVQSLHATSLERDGETEAAQELLDALASRDDVGPWIRRRAARRHACRGNWERAAEYADKNVRDFPGDDESWIDAATLGWIQADVERAMAMVTRGLQRCGPDERLVDAGCAALLDLVDHAELPEALRSMLELLEPEPRSIEAVAVRLIEAKQPDLGVEVLLHARDLMGRDLNAPWMVIRVLLGSVELARKHEATIDELLETTAAAARGFPYPALLRATRLLERQDHREALATLRNLDSDRAIAWQWELNAHALQGVGNDDEARELRARMAELPVDSVVNDVGFMCKTGCAQLAADLLRKVGDEQTRGTVAFLEAMATCDMQLGRPDAALATLHQIQTLDPSRDLSVWMANAAAKAGRFDALLEATARAIAAIERDSHDERDVWPLVARAAAAQLQIGHDPVAYHRLQTCAARHPGAWAAFFETFTDEPTDRVADDRRRLADFAPGLAARLGQPGEPA